MSAVSLVQLPTRDIPAQRSTPMLHEAWLLSLAAIVAPRRAGKRWQQVALWRAAAVAVCHLTTAAVLAYGFLILWQAWDQHVLRTSFRGPWVRDPWAELARVAANTRSDVMALLAPTPLQALVNDVMILVLLSLGLAVAFFILLPLGARPGSNRACLVHVARVVLLGTSFTWLWMLGLIGVVTYMILAPTPPGPENWMTPVFAVLTTVLLWTLLALGRVVRLDYRRPADMPGVITPRCDECGYDLHMSDPQGRCPECGRPVAASLDPASRPPTPWEQDPRASRLRVIFAQARDLVLQPRRMFFRMPTLTHHEAAQRWLALSMVLVGATVFWVVPLMGTLNLVEWSWRTALGMLVGGTTLAVVWIMLGMMMVGIETGGVTLVAFFRKHPVYLATAAKVTCYASILMIVWAILGGAQVYLLLLANDRGWLKGLAPRLVDAVTIASLGVAHIGGLLWYEWTVYRGLRGVQYANH